jgi:hypothetical protein
VGKAICVLKEGRDGGMAQLKEQLEKAEKNANNVVE